MLAAAALAAAATLTASGCAAPSSSGARSAAAPATSRPVTTAVRAVTVPAQALRKALGCPSATPVAVQHQVAVATRHPSLVVVARCVSSAGSPPSGVYVVTGSAGGSGGPGRINATLVATYDQVDVSTVTVKGATVRVRGLAYSGPDVPRCCPDRPYDRTWTAKGDLLLAPG